ncbi:MAG: hypothetical protein KF787_02555 [Phycisphaeraceae bacterium]|nr:hypothetical protein [Phycisphaerae bacterium]MBX3391507.1 hypothetical protein [Phycisphaeraceae bacterium]HRJ50276.1 hypothetical protein [Phycisphaerales bacterium]
MFVKTIVRTAVITGLVGGAAVIIAGPERVGCLVNQTRGAINNQIDKAIDDPIALRSQIRSLEEQYPRRIAEVRSDLAELRQQGEQLRRERELSDRVVALAERDFDQMKTLIARAQDAQSEGAIVRVVFNNQPVNLDDAYAKATRMQQVRETHAVRLADIDRDLGYLGQQEERLTELLGQLETEHAGFQTQLWQLDRQIDAIGRNDRMIATLEKRQETIDRHSRYRAESLDQLSARFAEIRSRQEARLQGLTSGRVMTNYEDRARIELDARNLGGRAPTQVLVKPPVIEIRPDDAAFSPREVESIGPKPVTGGVASRTH